MSKKLKFWLQIVQNIPTYSKKQNNTLFAMLTLIRIDNKYVKKNTHVGTDRQVHSQKGVHIV